MGILRDLQSTAAASGGRDGEQEEEAAAAAAAAVDKERGAQKLPSWIKHTICYAETLEATLLTIRSMRNRFERSPSSGAIIHRRGVLVTIVALFLASLVIYYDNSYKCPLI